MWLDGRLLPPFSPHELDLLEQLAELDGARRDALVCGWGTLASLITALRQKLGDPALIEHHAGGYRLRL